MANNMPAKTESVFINDPEVIAALEEYQKGKAIKEKGEQMMDKSRAVLDSKLFDQNIRNAYTDDLTIVITEYNRSNFNKEEFIKYHKDLYDQYTEKTPTKRYNIKERIEVSIND